MIHTQSVRPAWTSQIRLVLEYPMPGDIVQTSHQRDPDLEHANRRAISTQHPRTSANVTHIDALVRERVEHVKRLLLVLGLEALLVEIRRDDRFDQRVEERDERAGDGRNEGGVVPIRTLVRELVARVETLHHHREPNKKEP